MCPSGGSGSGGGNGSGGGKSGGGVADGNGSSIVTSPRRQADDGSDCDGDRGRAAASGSDAGSAGEESFTAADRTKSTAAASPKNRRELDDAAPVSPPNGTAGGVQEDGDDGTDDENDEDGGSCDRSAMPKTKSPASASRSHSSPGDDARRPRKRVVFPPAPRLDRKGDRSGGRLSTSSPPPRSTSAAEEAQPAAKRAGSPGGGSDSPRPTLRSSPVLPDAANPAQDCSDDDGSRPVDQGSGRPSSGSAGSRDGSGHRPGRTEKHKVSAGYGESCSPVRNASSSSPAHA
eukprot:TRINITY_DN266_c0_g1_i14.p2 TRINITY_DN266_c0_g1~~TRINITY_DN266_c0_g1_i14.p2  ORF type:complete len:289 (-),score=68.08 TRINITY_DN266_c0_g1_i14:1040-1906(-)